MGSNRAERQRWQLDLVTRTAGHDTIGYRELSPRSPNLDVTVISRKVCEAVKEGKTSRSDLIERGILTWKEDDQVVIKQGKLIPNDGPQQTVAGRRKRFRADLCSKMSDMGWGLVKMSQSMTFKKR